MKTITAACALAAAAWSFSAAATEPAPKPTSEHCDEHGHSGHAGETHCEHPKPAGH
jgi:hypothetical protein